MWITDAGQVALGSAEPLQVTRASRVGHVPERLEAKLGVRTAAGAVAQALRESA
jgi:hypothetical protein